jgi:5'-3' exoribonuclease 2
LREQQHLNNSKDIKLSIDDVSEPLSYLCIKNVIKTYNDYITNKLRDNTEFLEPELYEEVNKKLDNANYDFSKDFIILCFMLGNDFIPHLPSINIRNDGIEYITEAYCKMFELTQQLIYDDKTKELNYNNLKIIFDYLGELEDEYFKDVLPKFKQRSQNRKCNAKNDYERELWEHDNLKNIIQEDYIKLGDGIKEDYKFRYYEHNFHSRINQHKLVNNICKNYVDMMNWITKYYFDIDMPSWQFCYYFDEAPFASDIANYLYDENSIIKRDIEYKNPIKIEKQLLSVIPPYYTDMLKKIRNIDISKFKTKKTQYMFPTQYNLDYNNDQYWMCEVKLPVLDLTLF